MTSNMHFEGIKSVASMKKATKKEKRIKYIKKENIIIKINIHMQHTCLTDFAIRRMHRNYDATFYINTLNLKVNDFSLRTILCPDLSILRRPFT